MFESLWRQYTAITKQSHSNRTGHSKHTVTLYSPTNPLADMYLYLAFSVLITTISSVWNERIVAAAEL